MLLDCKENRSLAQTSLLLHFISEDIKTRRINKTNWNIHLNLFKAISKIKKGSIVIEDKKEVIEKLKDYDEFKTVWINRKYDKTIENVQTVNNLLEIVDLLAK